MRNLVCGVLVVLSAWQWAGANAIDAYAFSDSELEARFRQLNQELRCVVCQNQSLADSNSALAKDLRQEVYDMLQTGQSDDEIKDFLVQRYGDFVLYRPPVKPETWGLWFGPGVILLLVLAGLLRMYLKRRRGAAQVETGLNQDEQARLARLLGDDKGDV